jgi:hypothetical protein
MQVNERLFIDAVRYGDGSLVVRVIPQIVTDEGRVVGDSGFHEVSVAESVAVARGVENGRTDGEWGNREVEQVVLADQVMLTPMVPPVPGMPEVRDAEGNVLQAAVPGTEMVPATYGPRFGSITTIAWR